MKLTETTDHFSAFAEVPKSLQELKTCRDDKDQLSKQLVEVQEELIDVLKRRG